jgi:hypothetical protein
MSGFTSRSMRRAGLAAAVLALALVAGGCWNPFSPEVAGRGVSEPPPAPNSASNVVHLFEWCYKHRSFSDYRELFTADYRFVFSNRDSAGRNYPADAPWTRDDELESTRKLFEGGDANQPAATSITLTLDKNFKELNDPRPGKNNALQRKSITTQVNLTITTTDGASTNVFGSVTFYLVRGDSANIPQELVDLGFGPDPNRWYIEQWLDNTNGTAVAGAMMRPVPGRLTRAPALIPPAALRTFGAPVTGTAGVRRTAAPADLPLPFYATWGQVKAWYH